MSQLPQGYPVHYVITVPRRDGVASQYGIDDIVGSFACDLSEIDAIYQRYILPLQSIGVYCRWHIFGREGPNPFLEAEAKHRQEIDEILARHAEAHAETPPAEPDYRDPAAWE